LGSMSRRHRRVDVRYHKDAKVRPLSKDGRALFLHCLCCGFDRGPPGLLDTLPEQLAKVVNCPPRELVATMREIQKAGIMEADWEAGVIWIPNRVYGDEPRSPDNVRAWAGGWDEVAECALKAKAWETLRAYCESRGAPFVEAFMAACPHPDPQGRFVFEEPKPEEGSTMPEPKPEEGSTIAEPSPDEGGTSSASASASTSASDTLLPTVGGSRASEGAGGGPPIRNGKTVVPVGLKPDDDPVFLTLKAIPGARGDGFEFEVRESFVRQLEDLYGGEGGLDVRHVIREIKAYQDAKPKDRSRIKTQEGWPDMIRKWLKRDFDKRGAFTGRSFREPVDQKPPTQAQAGWRAAQEQRRREEEARRRSSTVGDPGASERVKG